MDLAPNFSGGLMAIGNTLTNVFIVLMPLLVSTIVTDVVSSFVTTYNDTAVNAELNKMKFNIKTINL